MNGFQWWSSRSRMVLLVGLVVALGMLAEHHLRERIRPIPLQVPAAAPSSPGAPVRADGPLHEVSQHRWTDAGAQPRWVF